MHAKAVNCLSGEKDEPCTICKTCKEIDSGNFIDVIEIDAASNRGVEEIQHILEQTQYAPSLGLKKVIITLGEKGLFYSDGKEDIYLKEISVKALVTTGEGDAFNGGLAFALSHNKPIK